MPAALAHAVWAKSQMKVPWPETGMGLVMEWTQEAVSRALLVLAHCVWSPAAESLSFAWTRLVSVSTELTSISKARLEMLAQGVLACCAWTSSPTWELPLV